jgi:protein LSM14
MGSMNLSNGQGEAPRGRGGHRGERGRTRGHGRPHPGPIPAAASIPTTDFDFQSNNQRFDKKATAQEHPALQSKPATPAENATPTDRAENATNGPTESSEPKKDEFYNPSKSFFDNISSDANKMKPERPAWAPAERARGRGRGRGRSRREEERDRNVETFGEAGGVGLLGPGQYVGGFGGYRGRRRRSAPRGAGPGAPSGGRGRGTPRAVVVRLYESTEIIY